jgi:hypothetical protein
MCKDKAINYLDSIGFNAIHLPMEGIEPLLVMRTLESGCLEALGSVVDLIKPCTPRLTPEIKMDCSVQNPTLTGLVTDSFGFDIGTGIINKILGQFGVKNTVFQELGISFQKVRKIQFTFDNIFCDATTTGQLAHYLITGKACEVKDILEDMIIDYTWGHPDDDDDYSENYNPKPDKRTFYSVVIKTLKSNSLSIFAYDEQNTKVNLGVQFPSGISSVAGCQVSSKSENSLTFKGDKYLTFAVQIAALFVEKRGTQVSNSLICKYTLPDGIDNFTGKLFTPKEDLGLHPLFDYGNEESTAGVKLVSLNQGNPINVSFSRS